MMEINENIFDVCVASLMAQVADSHAAKCHIAVNEALRLFLASKTYALLDNAASYLYLEPGAYVEEMFDAELAGDWERWLEV